MGNFFKLDVREFNRTIDLYLDLTRRDRINELNRRAANICARASKLTDKADPEEISDDMKAVETVTASYVKTTKKRGEYVALSKGGKTTQKQATVNYMGSKEAFKIANWRLARGKRLGFYNKFPAKLAGPGKGKKGGTASQFYNKFVKRARSSAGYIAAGWLPPFYYFKGKTIGKTIQPDNVLLKFFRALKGSAGLGYGIDNVFAAGDIVKAVFVNAAAGVAKIGPRALQNAINEEEADMKVKIAQEQQKIADKASRTR
jgi:hypothetical protein